MRRKTLITIVKFTIVMEHHVHFELLNSAADEAVFYAGLFVADCKQGFFFACRLVFAPEIEHKSDYSRRGTQVRVPLLECRSCEDSGLLINHLPIFLLEKKLIKQSPLYVSPAAFLTRQFNKKLLYEWSEILASATLEKRETDQNVPHKKRPEWNFHVK